MIPQSPTSSIVYALWLRTRAILLVGIAGALIVPAVSSALPPIAGVVLSMFAGLALIGGLAILMGFVTYGGADLSTAESVFPRHMFVFPVRTRTLVLVPMLYGAPVVAVFWVLLARAAFLPAGVRLPLIWPAAALAALVAWLQAASWSPYRLPFVRIFVSLGVILLLTMCGVAAQVYHVNPMAIVGFTAVVGICAYPFGAAGVARARRGDGTQPAQVGATQKVRPEGQPPVHIPFRSASRAQLWLDLRRNVWYPPVIAFGVVLVLATFQAAIRDTRPNPFLPPWLPVQVLWLLDLLVLPLFLVTVHAMLFGKFDMWSKALTFPAFLTTRPISSAAIVFTKLRSAAIISCLVWVSVLPVLIAYMCIPRSYDAGHSWLTMLLDHATPRVVAAVLLSFILLLLFTWKIIVQSLWITMFGRMWMIHALPSVAMLGMAGLGWLGYWINADPHRRAAVIPWIGSMVYALAITKAVAAVMTFMSVSRMRLMDGATIARAASAWLSAVVVLCAAMLLIFAPLRHALALLLCGMILFIPLVRPILAIPALHYNRHR